MATVAEIQRAGLIKQDGYDHFYVLNEQFAKLAHARCFAFMIGHGVEESDSDIEGTYTTIQRTDFIYLTEEEAQRLQHRLFQERDAFFQASLRSHRDGPLNIQNFVSGQEDMALVEIIDAHNAALAIDVSDGDTTSDYAQYLRAKDITVEELAQLH